MLKKKINRLLASAMMALLSFNCSVPYYVDAAGDIYIDEGGYEAVNSDEAEISENDIEYQESEDIEADEPIIEEPVPTEEADDNDQPETDDVEVETHTSGDYEYTLTDSVATITEYKGTEKEVIIPNTLDGYPVKVIGSCAFFNCNGIASVKLPDGLKKIEEDAFRGCIGITSIDLPEELEEIGSYAFAQSQITYVKIPSSISSLNSNLEYNVFSDTLNLNSPSSAFSGCMSLETIEFAEGVKEVPAYGLAYLESLNKVILPKTITSINTGAFYYDEKLTAINLHDGITSIDDAAFEGCKSLESITIPKSIVYIKDNTFNNCTGITTVIFNSCLESIGSYAFSGCSSIESINLPNGLKEIGSYAFSGLAKITSIKLPEGLESIGTMAFSDTPISYIKIPSTIKTLNSDSELSAFSGCKMLETVEYGNGLKEVPEYGITYISSLKEIILPESVTLIKNGAFCNNTNLTTINLPDGIISIGAHSFDGCLCLNSLTLPQSTKEIGQYAFNKCKGITLFKLNTCLETIDDYAFAGCVGITSLNFHEGLRKIGMEAFSGCNGLTSLSLPEGVEEIGSKAFKGSQITYVKIPSTIISLCSHTSITPNYDYEYESAFTGCNMLEKIEFADGIKEIPESGITLIYSLNEVILPETVTLIKRAAFYANENLSVINLPDGITSIGTRAFERCICLNSIIIPQNTIEIGFNAFKGCTGITSVSFNLGLETIASEAFYGCTAIHDLDLPEGIKEIGTNAFAGSQITYVRIPSNVINLGGAYDVHTTDYISAFSKCVFLETVEFADGIKEIPRYGAAGIQSLKKIVIPETVTKINKGAFGYNENLSTINLPDGIITIGEDAFIECKSLSSINIPNNTEEIDESAFWGCSGLTSVSFNLNIKKIGMNAFHGCSGISSLDLPEGLKEIDVCAFAGCSLTYIKIPSTINTLNYPFMECETLKTVEFADGLKEIPYRSLEGATIKEVLLPESITSIGDSAFYHAANLKDVVIPANCISIGDSAFKNCDNLEAVLIPRSVNSIAQNAFINDTKLTIYGYADSYAQTYANSQGISFVAIDDIEYKNGDGFDLKKNGYCFMNQYFSFHYDAPDKTKWKLPLERYQAVYGNSYTQHIYDHEAKGWNGNCFGMSATAVLFFKNQLSIADYKQGVTDLIHDGYDVLESNEAGKYYALYKDSKLTELIENYQVYSYSVECYRLRYRDSLKHFNASTGKQDFESIISIIESDKEPFLLTVNWDGTGHALVVDSSRTPQPIGNGWYRVFLYDPNNPYNEKYDELKLISFYKAATDRYIELNIYNDQWRMDVDVNGNGSCVPIGYDIYGNLTRNSMCCFYETSGYPTSFDKKASFASNDNSTTISYRSNNVTLYDKNDRLIYKKSNGVIEYINSDIVYDNKYSDHIEGLEGGADEGMLILPEGQYKVIIDNGMIGFGNNGDYAGVVTQNDQITVTNTAPNALSVSADKSVSVNIVVMDSYAGDKFSSIETDVIVSDKGCEVSMSENILDIDTNDDQKFDVDIITDEGHGEIKDTDSDEVENTDIEDYTETVEEYKITYDLDGGTVTGNPTTYTADTESFTLINPTKEGYVFKGWTGSNGNIPQITVVIEKGTKGDLSFKANWGEESNTVSSNSAMNPVPVINGDTTEIHLVKGQKFTLAENGWSCADKKFLSVSKKNVVTAKKVTTTPVKLVNGDRSIDVYITKPAMAKKSVTIQAGSSQPIEFAYDSENLPIQWYSNAPDVATVSANGTVTAIAKGTATVTAYVNGSAFNCKVKVKEDTAVQERTLHMTVNTKKTISIKGLKKVTWVPDDSNIVSVNKGNKLTAVSAGATNLRAEYENKEYIIKVFVEDPAITSSQIQSDGKNKYKLTLNAGESSEIVFSNIEQSVIFKSSKGDVAYMEADGTIHANNPGKAKLTAKINGKLITINVTVK